MNSFSLIDYSLAIDLIPLVHVKLVRGSPHRDQNDDDDLSHLRSALYRQSFADSHYRFVTSWRDLIVSGEYISGVTARFEFEF